MPNPKDPDAPSFSLLEHHKAKGFRVSRYDYGNIHNVGSTASDLADELSRFLSSNGYTPVMSPKDKKVLARAVRILNSMDLRGENWDVEPFPRQRTPD